MSPRKMMASKKPKKMKLGGKAMAPKKMRGGGMAKKMKKGGKA